MKEVTLWVAQDLNGPDAREQLRAEIEKAMKDPRHSVITNHPLYYCRVEQGNFIVADDARADQIELIRGELEKAWADPTYIPIVTTDVSVFMRPWSTPATDEQPAQPPV